MERGGARTTPSPQASSSGLTRGSASRPLRALSPPPQILASRARMTEERWGEDGGGEVGARRTEERRGAEERGETQVERCRRGRRGRGGGEDDTLSACVILGLDPRIRLPPAPGVVAAAADPRLKGEDDGGEVGEEDGGEVGARTAVERRGRGRRGAAGARTSGLRGGSEDDTLSACVILGLDPRICLPPRSGRCRRRRRSSPQGRG